MILVYILLSATLLHGFLILVMRELMEISADEADQRYYDSMKGTLWQEVGRRPQIGPPTFHYRDGRYDVRSLRNLAICLFCAALFWVLVSSV